jgi:hypothetical protein
MQPHVPFLALHIAAGGAALLASLVAIGARKGGPLHVRAGRIFALALLRPNAFLFTLGLFSLYLVTAGREAARPGPVGRLAAAAALVMLAAAAGMVVLAGGALLGWSAAARLTGRLPPAALMVFGAIGAAMAAQDLRAWAAGRPEPARRRTARHLARMGGAAIAAWTAFVVVNARFLPPPVAWLGPTLLLLPLIAYWQRRVLNGRAAAAPRPS